MTQHRGGRLLRALRPTPRAARGRFVPCSGNSLQVLAGGDTFYADLLPAIESAQVEVLLCTYLWADDATGRRFLDAAEAAARRGVRVVVMPDGVGSFSISGAQLDRLRAAGAQAAFYNPVRRVWVGGPFFRRNHRKNLIVDGRLAWTGGAGFADGWAGLGEARWWDVMARVDGPIVAQLRQVFRRDWWRCTGELLPDMAAPAPDPRNDERLRVLPSGLTQRELLPALLREIRLAQSSISIASAYFVPTWQLRRRLRAAARRGVDVRLVLAGPNVDHYTVWFAGRRHYGKLLAAGVRIFEWQQGLMHAKFALVDRAWGAIGSSNLDAWSARVNHELDLELTSAGALDKLRRQFEDDLRSTREIERQRWRERPLRHRLAEQVVGWIDPLL